MITEEKLDQYKELFKHPYIEQLLINSTDQDIRRFEAIRTVYMAYLDADFDPLHAQMQITEMQNYFEDLDSPMAFITPLDDDEPFK